MTSRSFKKYANLGIEEEKDFFLAALNKRIRNARKKIEQIDDLSKKDKSTLKQEQIDKINSRAEVLETIRYTDDVKEIYYSSYKTAREEGKVPHTAIEVTSVPQSAEIKPAQQAQSQAQPQAQQNTQTEEQRQAESSKNVRDTLSKVLNLVHFVQFFRDQGHVQEFKQALESVPDLESLHEFYTKVFTFSESDKFVKIEDKLNRSLSELESYITSAQQPALRNQSYGSLQSVVQRVAESSSYKEHKADVSTRQNKTEGEHSAIGSELKKGQEQVEAPVSSQQQQQQAKHKSPEKEAKPQEATKVSPVKEAKRDWGTVEDDEEEGLDTLREEEQEQIKFEGEGGRAVEESEKPYTSLRDKQAEEEQKQPTTQDEWATVTAKRKEKKPEPQARGGNRPYRGGDGYRGDRGGQRGPRPEGDGDQKRERRPPRDQEEGQEGNDENSGRPRGTRGGYRGNNRGGPARGGYEKRDGGQGDEYKRKEGDTYQKKAGEGASKATEGQ